MVPVPVAEPDRAAGPDDPVALMRIIVAMTAITSSTGTSAVTTGCRERNEDRSGVSRRAVVPDLGALLPPDRGGGRFVAPVAEP